MLTFIHFFLTVTLLSPMFQSILILVLEVLFILKVLYDTIIPEIPIFFATDDNYASFLSVTLKSMFSNASPLYFYKIHILETNLSAENKRKLQKCLPPNASIQFVNIKNELNKVESKLHLRDYYSKETYYRFFIADLFPQYDKVLYLDCDLAVIGDISELYNTDLGDNYVGAVPEEVMSQVKVFGDYVERALDIKTDHYFNAGILLINTKAFREIHMEELFVDLLNKFKFSVTQDQDYLNVLCKNRVKYFDLGWNKTAFKNDNFNDENLRIIHYKINWKPWHYDGVEYEDYFWNFAKKTSFYNEILEKKNKYTREQRERDQLAYENLVQLAIADSNNPDNYRNVLMRSLVKA